MMSGADLLLPVGPTVLAIAVSNTASSAFGHRPTSAPYKAAGKIMVRMATNLCACVIGSAFSLYTHFAARRNRCASVLFVPVRSKHVCAPRSLYRSLV